jgi:hypothetical protein
MKKAVAGTEVLLTVGILIAVGVTLVELKGVFYGQEVLTQEEVVVEFSRDLDNTVDRAMSTTGDVAFVYYPRIKNYRVTISSVQEKKEAKPITEDVKKELAREIYKELKSPIACVQNDVCSNKEKFGESSYSSELTNLNLEEAVKNAISKMTDVEITSYSIDNIQKNEIKSMVDFCTVELVTINQYDFTINFVTSLGEEFALSSLDISSSMFDIKYSFLSTNQLKAGEVFRISDADLELKSVGRIYALKTENISGPINYANGKVFVKNLDDHEKKCRSGIYCGGGDCGAITFGHFEYIYKPAEQLALEFHPTASEGDFIIFCDDGSFAKKHMNFLLPESQEETPKIEPPSKKFVSLVTIYDKVSKKSTGFSKPEEIVKNVFEDSDKIWIIKKQNKIYILGKCAENGGACFNSLGCCSGFCWGEKNKFECKEKCAENDLPASDSDSCCSKFLNESTGLCSNPPVCPERSACNGATDEGMWKDINNTDCCPGDNPICSSKYCCPEDKPKYCRETKDGSAPRCMNVDEYKNNCKACPATPGPNEDSLCDLTPGNPVAGERNKNVIDVCKPEPPMLSTVNSLIFSDATLSAEVNGGRYDNAVRKIWKYVFVDLYRSGANYCFPACADKTASGFIDRSIPCGVCNHWAVVILSLIRTMGVSEDRVYNWDFCMPQGCHAVAAYKSDGGEWWVLDTTCCQALVPLSSWHSSCSGCACSSCVAAYFNDYGIYNWNDRSKFDSACSIQMC